MEELKTFPQSRKRPFQHDIQSSPYYKMRDLLRDVRPHFIEVFKSPDCQNCKAADDVRQGIKLLMELYQEMTAESTKLQKCSNGDIDDGQKPMEHQQDIKPAENSLLDGVTSMKIRSKGRISLEVQLLVGTSSHSMVAKLSITGKQKRLFGPEIPSPTE